MRKNTGVLDAIPVHPFLFPVYALLALWAVNLSETPFYALARAALIVLIFLVLAWVVSLIVLRNWVKASILTTLFLLLFLTYGHIYPLVDKLSVFGWNLGRHRYLVPACFALLGLAGLFLGRAKAAPRSLNGILNLVSVFLVALSLVQILTAQIRSGAVDWQLHPGGSSGPVKQASGTPVPIDGPDVYYILLDGFSRADLIEQLGGPQLEPFLKKLEKMGFTVIRCAQSNYDRTPTSMASALNMDYIDALGVKYNTNDQGIYAERYEELLKHSLVRKKFEAMGYQVMTFKAVYDWIDITDSDYYVNNEQALPIYNRLEVINFQYLFLTTTMLRPLMEQEELDSSAFERLPLFVLQLLYPRSSVFTTREYKHYQQNLYALQQLSEAPSLPGKKFVYAHLFLTHQPYTFNADGSFRWPPKDDTEAYLAQIEYASQRIPEIIAQILRDSKTPPVIILQSDHGYTMDPERVRILNAYYLPGENAQPVDPGITPVNSFRLVFNRYFQGNYEMLPNRTFHSPNNFPYQFQEINPQCPAAVP